MTKKRPWQRQRDPDGNLEPAMWFSRFDKYFRPQGPERSMLAAYNLWRKTEKGRDRPTDSTSEAWRRNDKRWRWRERAEAWDAHEAEKRHTAEAQAAAEAREQRIGAFKALLARGYEKVRHGIESEAQAVRAIDTGAKGLRLEYGEVSAIIEGRGPLSADAEWLELRGILLAALAGYPEARQAVAAALLEVDSESS